METSYGKTFVYLQPYIHQVGGHSSMLCLDEKRVCKPAIDQELAFYGTLPLQLKQFTPAFYGIVEVNVQLEDDYMYFIAYNEKSAGKSIPHNGRLKLRKSGSIEILHSSCQFEDCSFGKNRTIGMNPWGLKCHQDHLASLAKAIDLEESPKNFLVMENLTSSFRFPCVLDLKMGIRQYDEKDSLAKRQRKMYKVVSTTSGKLGLRIAGMQVYQITTGKFLCRNKLYGREISQSGFMSALKQFLHDGVRLRTELLPPFIRKLEEMAETLSDLKGLRLITTSLLLLYEGDSSTLVPSYDRLKEKREGILKSRGLSLDAKLTDTCSDSLERCFSVVDLNILPEGLSETRKASRLRHRRRSSSCAGQPRSYSEVGLCELAHEEPVTDIRVIDFAHSTHKGMAGSHSLQGPDESFLFGLENIIAILKQIEMEHL